jgi:hypothetical protein
MSLTGWILDVFTRRDEVKDFTVKVKARVLVKILDDGCYLASCPALNWPSVEGSSMSDGRDKLKKSFEAYLGGGDD